MVEWKEKAKTLWKKQKFGKDSFLIMILGGLLLLVIAWPTDSEGEQKRSDTQSASQYNSGTGNGNYIGTQSRTDADNRYNLQNQTELSLYAADMEARLVQILEAMEGVGEVEVMITYATNYELVPLQEVTQSSSGTQEADANGGTRTVNEQSLTQQTVYTTDEQGNQVPYVISTKEPEIIGVAVCAQGGGNPVIQTSITEVIQSLFRIEANRIIVTRMKS